MKHGRENSPGKNEDPISASGNGAQSAKTIAKGVTLGIFSPMIRPAPVLIAGAKMV